jgi:hypothetical protein
MTRPAGQPTRWFAIADGAIVSASGSASHPSRV